MLDRGRPAWSGRCCTRTGWNSVAQDRALAVEGLLDRLAASTRTATRSTARRRRPAPRRNRSTAKTRRMNALRISLPRRTAGACAAGPDAIGRAGHVACRSAGSATPRRPRSGARSCSRTLGLGRGVGHVTVMPAAQQAPVHLRSLLRVRPRWPAVTRRTRMPSARVSTSPQARASACGVAAGRHDAGVPAQIADRVGQRRHVPRVQVVEQAVEQQQLGLVHRGGGEPGPPGDHVGCRAERHVGPGREQQPVQDRGGQRAPVPGGQPGQPGGVLDQAADPERRAAAGPACGPTPTGRAPRPGRGPWSCPGPARAARRRRAGSARPARRSGRWRRADRGSGCRARFARKPGIPGGSWPTGEPSPAHAERRPRRRARASLSPTA